jgi:hypothetical protein
MGDAVMSTEPGKWSASGIERRGFTYAFVIQALVADGYALFAEDVGDPRL